MTDRGSLNEHLTAMRYSDWALGQFFEQARKEPYFKETLFVVVGDHGFGNEQQITQMDLGRFNVPMLLIGPGVQEKNSVRSTTPWALRSISCRPSWAVSVAMWFINAGVATC